MNDGESKPEAIGVSESEVVATRREADADDRDHAPISSGGGLTTTCVDLKARFGERYRIRKEADGVTWYATPETERLWLLELRCRYGVVYPHGGDLLGAVVTS